MFKHVARGLFGLWIDHIMSRVTETDQFKDSSDIEDISDIEMSENSSDNEDYYKYNDDGTPYKNIRKKASLESFLAPKYYRDKVPKETKIKAGRYSRIYPYKLRYEKSKVRKTILWPAAIIYLSCCIIQHPLYLSDILRWIHNDEFPLKMGRHLVPEELLKKVSPTFINISLKGSVGPYDNALAFNVGEMGAVFRDIYNYEIPNLPINTLLFKLIYMLFLPPEVYPTVLKFIQLYQIEFDITMRDKATFAPTDDRVLYTIIIIVCKLIYGFDNIIRHPRPHEPGAEIVDWELWMSLVYRSWVDHDSFGTQNPLNVLYWDTKRMARCLDWAEDQLFTSENNLVERAGNTIHSSVKRSIRKLFPIKPRTSPNIDLLNESILFAKRTDNDQPSTSRRSQRSQTRSRHSQGPMIPDSQATIPDILEHEEGDNEEDQEIDSDEELRRVGVHLNKFTHAKDIMERDLYSEYNPNIYRPETKQGVSFKRKAVNEEIDQGTKESLDFEPSSSSEEAEEFVEDKLGNIFRKEDQDLEDDFEHDYTRQKIVVPTDHTLLEINQLINSTTVPYEIQLTKFTDDGKQDHSTNDKKEKKLNKNKKKTKTGSNSADRNSREEENGSEWEDMEIDDDDDDDSYAADSEEDSEFEQKVQENPNAMHLKEKYEDALLYPGDYLASKNKRGIEYASNKYFLKKYKETGDSQYLKHVTKFKEHNHSSRPVIPRESVIMDLKNTRYMGHLLRPGHRYTKHGNTTESESELVNVLIEAAPAVIGSSPENIRRLLFTIENVVVNPTGIARKSNHAWQKSDQQSGKDDSKNSENMDDEMKNNNKNFYDYHDPTEHDHGFGGSHNLDYNEDEESDEVFFV